MAAKKKSKNTAKAKRPAAAKPRSKPQAKANAKAKAKAKAAAAPQRMPPRAKLAAAPKQVELARLPQRPEDRRTTAAPVTPPEPISIVRPGLQKRADLAPIGVVTVMDGDREIEQSTFYSSSGRDEYVQRWEARGYDCRFTRWNN